MQLQISASIASTLLFLPFLSKHVEDMKKEEAATLHEKPLTDTVSLESTMLALQDVISGKKKRIMGKDVAWIAIP